MQQQSDAQEFSHLIRDYTAVVNKLEERGQITFSKANDARSYLSVLGEDLAGEAKIPDGSTILLSNLAITYLQVESGHLLASGHASEASSHSG